MANRTPLYDRHVALGARMVDFGGWDMPQQYTSIKDEHLAVRRAAGLFDVSHMGRLNVVGDGASDFLNMVVTNDVSQLEAGHAQYNLMCNEAGGVIDDLVIYKSSATDFIVVVNASNREKDVAWLRSHLPKGASMEDRTRDVSLIAFQGPRAEELLPRGTSDTTGIPYFGFTKGSIAGAEGHISRTGYTGEDGFELFVPTAHVGEVWDAILQNGKSAGVLPAGLGARDACRLEAALRLWGNDMDETVNAYEAGLGWTVKLDKGDFIGREALLKAKESGPARRMVGLSMKPGDIPRHGTAVLKAGTRIGTVTSGTHSFFLEHPIALALVEGPSLRAGDVVAVDVRGREAPAEVTKLPFYRGSAHSVTAPARN
ncbi:MAG TPA: glycine cleavage system aminomethyltransferase GcvT [Candidatus Dormibacteraeota bacterium]|nr:glycine cleavage system aminomethyltransferase GcvT [Candidatus Dormibacteraeota bacterium]